MAMMTSPRLLLMFVAIMLSGALYVALTKNLFREWRRLRGVLAQISCDDNMITKPAVKETRNAPTTLREILQHKLPGQDPRVVELVRQQYLVPPSPLPYNLRTDADYVRVGSMLVPYIQRLFSKEVGGFFVEAGGLDGQFLSNSLWLEQHRGWRGLMAEPSVSNYEIMRTKHRNCWTSNTCLSRENYATNITIINIKLPKDRHDVLGMSLRGGTYESGVKQDPYTPGSWKVHKVIKTPTTAYCFPLMSYLLALNVSKVDFLSLDTQGAELDILKTIPWDILKVRVVVAEVVVESYGRRVEAFMVGKGFVVLKRGFDYWFAKQGDPVVARG